MATPGQTFETKAQGFVGFRIRTQGLFFDNVAAQAVADQEIRRALMEVGQGFERLADAATPEGATAVLRGSVFAEVRGVPARQLLAGWNAPYADIVDRGRRPGRWPPTAPILLWAKRVLDVPEKRLASAVFLIRRKIGLRGTPGHAFVPAVQVKLEALAQRALDAAAERTARRLSDRAA